MLLPLIVGELNPYGTDPRYALFPYPENSAGGRLCSKIMKLSKRTYLSAFDRANLCVGKWSAPSARASATELSAGKNPAVIFILLGVKVCKAFSVPFIPFSRYGRYIVLPHPSGRCRLWNEPLAYERARHVLREVLR